MQYTSLGRSGLQVSRLALGTMNFGELTGDCTSRWALGRIDSGIEMFEQARALTATLRRVDD
jgi:aryl-alcohol dehydrogenase-like predicted oxidoreductase